MARVSPSVRTASLARQRQRKHKLFERLCCHNTMLTLCFLSTQLSHSMLEPRVSIGRGDIKSSAEHVLTASHALVQPQVNSNITSPLCLIVICSFTTLTKLHLIS
eukprot:4650193-Amphidinium_carterae.4